MAATIASMVAGSAKETATWAVGTSTVTVSTPATPATAPSMDILQCMQWISGTAIVVSVMGFLVGRAGGNRRVTQRLHQLVDDLSGAALGHGVEHTGLDVVLEQHSIHLLQRALQRRDPVPDPGAH